MRSFRLTKGKIERRVWEPVWMWAFIPGTHSVPTWPKMIQTNASLARYLSKLRLLQNEATGVGPMLVECPVSAPPLAKMRCLESLRLWWMRFAIFEGVLFYWVIGMFIAWKIRRGVLRMEVWGPIMWARIGTITMGKMAWRDLGR